MTADPQLDQMSAWLAANDPGWRFPKSPADYEDEYTLLRSRRGLSRAARRESRRPRVDRPTEPWDDELSRCNPNVGAA